MTDTLDRRTLSEQITDALVARITGGLLQPGDRLVEMRIAEEMRTSQAPVREALRALAALGLVDMRPNRGAVVRGVDLAELRAIYEVRAALEGQAIWRATTAGPSIAPSLAALCTGMEQAVARGADRDFADLNDRYHRAIVEAAGNPVLLESWERLDIRARTAVNAARRGRDLSRALSEHRAIVTVVSAGDAAAARDLLIRHILGAVAEPAGEAPRPEP